jgi:hypothetical protein
MSRNPDYRALVARDPALATVLGAIPGHDFGYSAPAPRHSAPPPGASFGDDYGYGYGLDQFGASHARHGHHPGHGHPAAPPAHHHMPAPTSTEGRTLLLDPNRHSTVKVERYSFSFSPASALVLGTASAIASFTQQPSASVKPQRVLMNAPAYGFVTISQLQIANVNVFIGTTEDAFNYGATAQGVFLDLPRLDPQNRATAAGSYTGLLPTGFAAGTSYTFIVTLQGPAVLAGGYGQ